MSRRGFQGALTTPKYVTSVRFLVKDGKADEFLDRMKKSPNLGKTYLHSVQTGGLAFLWNATFQSEQVLIDSRQAMIAGLNRLKDLLHEIFAELGVTDPVSGPVAFES